MGNYKKHNARDLLLKTSIEHHKKNNKAFMLTLVVLLFLLALSLLYYGNTHFSEAKVKLDHKAEELGFDINQHTTDTSQYNLIKVHEEDGHTSS